MNPLRLLALLVVALLSACTWHPDTDQHAHKFFDEVRDMILSALKRQEAAVGERTWKATITDLDNRMSRHFRE
ncbi:MAG: hypothetical protein H6R46_847 [Proteobacteria bacterium]|jgi:outer membrane lipopolysaccharide assembly protein LptE/RlpB|nr:hypothetical protein [Pseudomonadota bacterium]